MLWQVSPIHDQPSLNPLAKTTFSFYILLSCTSVPSASSVCAQALESRLKLRFGLSQGPCGRPWQVGSPCSLLSSTRRPVGLLGCCLPARGGCGRPATCCGYRLAPWCPAERMASPGTNQRSWRHQLRGAAGLEKTVPTRYPWS